MKEGMEKKLVSLGIIQNPNDLVLHSFPTDHYLSDKSI